MGRLSIGKEVGEYGVVGRVNIGLHIVRCVGTGAPARCLDGTAGGPLTTSPPSIFTLVDYASCRERTNVDARHLGLRG